MRSSAIALLLIGCASSPGDSGACGSLSAEIGEGEFAYEPRVDGDAVTMVHGPQGGWHIDLAGEITGSSRTVELVPSIVEATQMVSIAGLDQADGPVRLEGWTAKRCTGTFHRLRAVIDDVEPGGSYQRFICTLEGNPFDVSVEITDLESGESLTAGFRARGALDPDDVAVCASL